MNNVGMGGSRTSTLMTITTLCFQKGRQLTVYKIQFNFPLFRGFCSKAYSRVNTWYKENIGREYVYTLDDCLSVFNCFFAYYEAYRKQIHPNLKVDNIESIIRHMPCLGVDSNTYIEPHEYEEIIKAYFNAPLDCDFRINHFMSGDIRLLRCYEAGII